MNESETRAKLIDPQLFANGWTEDHIIREHLVQAQKWNNENSTFADYVLTHRNTSLAVIEAKADTKSARDGVNQAITYTDKLQIRFAFATNGNEIIKIDLKTQERQTIDRFPTPDELWDWTFSEANEWRDRFNTCPWGRIGGQYLPRYYQKNAITAVLNAVALGETRLLLNLATGTGKTGIAFSIAWKLFETRWNLQKDAKRSPRILFLADRTTLADQAKKDFKGFKDDVMSRITPEILQKQPERALNANIFFSIFQTFSVNTKDQISSEDEDNEQGTPFFGTLPQDFFDFIIIDECHRGGAKDESAWRVILEYFSPAVQLGLTATPKRKNNVDTYAYFGEPLYTYSLKDGVQDGYLTPFRVRQIQTSLDDYQFNPNDTVISGEIDPKKIYTQNDWNSNIIIEDRERLLVKKLLETLPPYEKAIIFCNTQDHAAMIRDFIMDELRPQQNNYCVRVTSNDGKAGEVYLGQFQDNENIVPAVLTTSKKLTTGVDARNVRHVVLLRPVNNMIEFKQIIGRGTRLFEGKDYFTIHDFYKNHIHFADPEWDGEPVLVVHENPDKPTSEPTEKPPIQDPEEPTKPKAKLIIKLANGTIQEFQTIEQTIFYSADGEIISAESFINNLYAIMPTFFKNESELKATWANPTTRTSLLQRLAEEGISLESLISIQKMIHAENADVFDVLEFFAYNKTPLPKVKRAEFVRNNLYSNLTDNQIEFVEFLLESYIDKGHIALNNESISTLMGIKYNSFSDGALKIGDLPSLVQSVQNEIYK